MSDRDQQDSTRGSGGPEVETPAADANTLKVRKPTGHTGHSGH